MFDERSINPYNPDLEPQIDNFKTHNPLMRQWPGGRLPYLRAPPQEVAIRQSTIERKVSEPNMPRRHPRSPPLPTILTQYHSELREGHSTNLPVKIQ